MVSFTVRLYLVKVISKFLQLLKPFLKIFHSVFSSFQGLHLDSLPRDAHSKFHVVYLNSLRFTVFTNYILLLSLISNNIKCRSHYKLISIFIITQVIEDVYSRKNNIVNASIFRIKGEKANSMLNTACSNQYSLHRNVN